LSDRLHRAADRAGGGVLVTGLMLTLAGCGANGFAPDALVENPGAEAFLDRIQQNCAKLSVGNQQLDWLLSNNSHDTFFVDLTSKFWFDQINSGQYTDNINAFYPTGTNQAALDCIFKQRKA
jgi:hypothetical protein